MTISPEFVAHEVDHVLVLVSHIAVSIRVQLCVDPDSLSPVDESVPDDVVSPHDDTIPVPVLVIHPENITVPVLVAQDE